MFCGMNGARTGTGTGTGRGDGETGTGSGESRQAGSTVAKQDEMTGPVDMTRERERDNYVRERASRIYNTAAVDAVTILYRTVSPYRETGRLRHNPACLPAFLLTEWRVSESSRVESSSDQSIHPFIHTLVTDDKASSMEAAAAAGRIHAHTHTHTHMCVLRSRMGRYERNERDGGSEAMGSAPIG